MNDFQPQNHTVMLVDSDPQNRRELAGLLAREGFSTRAFTSAEELLEEVDEAPDGSCVITEIRLPGMSGVQLIRALRSRRRSLPVIVLTHDADVAVAVDALRSNVNDYLTRPFIERDLVNRLRAALTAAPLP